MYTTESHVTVVECPTIRTIETPCCNNSRHHHGIVYTVPGAPIPQIPLCAACSPDEPEAR